jgi:DNA-binding MarR family transcriptional regulator
MSASDEFRLANLVGALAIAVADDLTGLAQRTAGLAGRGPPALVSILSVPGETITELRDALGLTHSGAVRLVDRLAADGLVRREPAADGRTVALALTSAGREAAHRVLAEREARLAGLLRGLAPASRSALERAAEAVLHELTGERSDALRICRLCDAHTCGHPETCPVSQAWRRKAAEGRR